MAHVEFKPPSDFVPEGAGSGGGRNIWKILGIGCAVVLMIMGLALAFGAWKTVSCCGSAVDMLRRNSQANEFALGAAHQLKDNKLDALYAQFDPKLTEVMSLQELSNLRTEYAQILDAANPRMADLTIKSDHQYEFVAEFAEPSADQKLVLTLALKDLTPEKSETHEFSITRITLTQQTRILREEPAARAVLEFHRKLRAAENTAAYDYVERLFPTQAAFDEFLKDQQPVFREGTPEILSIEYGSGSRALLNARLSGADDQHVRVEYQMFPVSLPAIPYIITGITPVYEDAPQPTAPAHESAPDDAEPAAEEVVGEPGEESPDESGD